MTANLIDGKAIAADIRSEIKAEVEQLQAQYGKVPGLATVLVGSRKDSQSYVRMKKKACAEAGITSFGHDLPEDVSQEELLKVVQDLNANPDVHGILVQLPLPDHIDSETILSAISLEKDVDGFHPINIGRLSMKQRDPLYVPCTPKGCIELLDRTGVEIEGKRAVVLGRSNIVGLPVAMLLLHRNATLTVCHSRTQDLPGVVREADILIAAVGRPEMVRGDWIKPGAVVIDVGVNAVDDASRERGYRLVGDVAFDEAKEVAAAITPVPGGVGPMTIAMLLRNTTDSAKRAFEVS
jgi:5,10-methylene-tetrahydrofolate dehydrogenase/methenyl tetrahydrofolate cyclohydrolase